ncbi:MAG: heme iron utilization protein [Alphaproteobacteria bacterium]|nr:heme iron utilization protein [Alphaproteobacteria bacterium]
MSLPGDQAADAARRLIRVAARGALATIDRAGGAPYASLVLVATTMAAAPLLLLSGLAEHSRNLAKDGRASLMLDEGEGLENPLTAPRVMIQGSVVRDDAPAHRARYLARHPAARLYAELGDFAVYRLVAEQVHLVAGFGKARWLRGEAVLGQEPPELAAAEGDILASLEGRSDAIAALARRLGGVAGVGWRISGLDPEGCDLAKGGERRRFDFEAALDRPRTILAAIAGILDQIDG